MTNLNSILIEGYLKDMPVIEESDSKSEARFTLISKRFYKESSEKEAKSKESHVPILVESKVLVEGCQKYGKKGAGARVVGRLDYPEAGSAVIVAEHVEFRKEKN